MPSPLPLLLFGAVTQTNVFLATTEDVPAPEAQALLDSLGDAIAARTGQAPRLSLESPCPPRDKVCIDDWLIRHPSESLVLVHAVGVAGRVGLSMEVHRPDGPTMEGETVLEAEATQRSGAITALVNSLIEAPWTVEKIPVAVQSVEPSHVDAPIYWALIAGGGLAILAGGAFQLSADSIESDIEGSAGLDVMEYRELRGRQDRHQVLAGTLLGTGIASVTGGLIWALLD